VGEFLSELVYPLTEELEVIARFPPLGEQVIVEALIVLDNALGSFLGLLANGAQLSIRLFDGLAELRICF